MEPIVIYKTLKLFFVSLLAFVLIVDCMYVIIKLGQKVRKKTKGNVTRTYGMMKLDEDGKLYFTVQTRVAKYFQMCCDIVDHNPHEELSTDDLRRLAAAIVINSDGQNSVIPRDVFVDGLDTLAKIDKFVGDIILQDPRTDQLGDKFYSDFLRECQWYTRNTLEDMKKTVEDVQKPKSKSK